MSNRLRPRRDGGPERRILAVPVHIACNDPDNGLFDHRARSIHFGELLQLDSDDWVGPRMAEVGDDRIRVSRRLWPVVDRRYSVGNWCWNVYWVPLGAAAALLRYARALRFRPDLATDDSGIWLWDHWDEGFPADDTTLEVKLMPAAVALANRRPRS